MNRNLLFTLTLMIIAIIGIGTVAASDVSNITDVEDFDMGNMVIDNNNDIHTISLEENNEKPVIDDNTTIDNIPLEENNEKPVIDDNNNNDTINVEENNKEIVIYDNNNIENYSIDEVVIEENDTPVINGVDETANISDEVILEDGNTTYSQLMNIFNPNFKDKDKLDVPKLFHTYDEILELYTTGHTTDKIGVNYNMTTEQVQNLVDIQYPTIKEDASCDAIYKLYGSHTLDEIAQKLQLSKQNVLLKIHAIKEGYFGSFFKRMLLKRDLKLLNEGNIELIIK